ncbi:hypothetical protein PFISCL1PPCAC_15180, partial [Pristionchus fissidentatus]
RHNMIILSLLFILMISLSNVILSFCLLIHGNTQHPKLIQVQIIIRHADRAPIHQFTSLNSSFLFPRGLGEISDIGIRRAAEMGRSLRRRYRLILKENKIFIRSSPVTRTLASAASFSNAFIGRKKNNSIPLIHTTENELDEQVLISIDSPTFRCKVLHNHNISDSMCRISLLKDKIVQSYPKCAWFSYNIIEAAISEIENSDMKMNENLKKCAREDGRKIQFKTLSFVVGIGREIDEDRLKDTIGSLLAILKKNIKEIVESKPKESIRVYYTHDHIIVALAQTLGIISEFEERVPEFSSTIILETWKMRDGIEIRVSEK